MNFKRWTTWSPRIALPIVCTVFLGVTAVAGGPSSASIHAQNSIGGDGKWTAVAENSRADGTVEDIWRGADGSLVTAVGLPGVHVTVLPEIVTHGPGQRVDHKRGIAISGGMSKSAILNNRQSGMQLANSIYQRQCGSYTSPDGHVYLYGCDVQYLDQSYGWDWYMADKQQTSARSDCSGNYFCDHLTQVYSYVSYVGGNQMLQWTPSATASVGSCTNFGISYTSNYSNITYSESQEVCPSTFGPYTLNGTQFGSIWKGRTPDQNNFWVGNVAEDEVHNPPNVGPWFTYYQYLNWCSWCL